MLSDSARQGIYLSLADTRFGIESAKYETDRKNWEILGVYFVRSWVIAFGALLLTDLIPFLQAATEVYASLLAIGSPFAALSRHLNCPDASL
jgi:hypothetical protein